MPMVRTASAAAALVFAAGLGSAALAQEPPAAKASAPVAAKAEPAAPVIVPVALPATPALSQAMQAQAMADAPPPPPPPPAPIAAPSIPVVAEGLAPAARPVTKVAFAAPPAGVVEAAKAPAAPVATPIQAAVAAPAPAPVAAPVFLKAVVAEPAPAPVAAPTPRAATPSANALVARRVTDAAGAFDAWTEKAARIDGKFADASGVSAALVDTSSFQAQQLEEGAVAFGALVALQDPVFVQSAHELATMGGDHDQAAAILLKDPSQVMTLPGADSAAAFTAQSLSKRAQAVVAAGKAVRQAAYSMQVDPWAKTAVPTPDKRLAEAKSRSAVVISLDGPASELLMKRLVELRTSRQSVAAAGRAGAPTPVVTRSLALAAMIVLGEADEAHAAALTPILTEAKTDDCLKMAKLNFHQCLSVAGPHYEDAFCVGQHGLGEAGQCLAMATGVSAPVPAAAPVLIAAAAPVASAGVSVPIALLAEGGPERSAAFAAPPAPSALQPAPSAPIQLAQAAPALSENQPRWAREPAPQPRYAQAPQDAQDDDTAPTPAPRLDRGNAYRWERQSRSADYAGQGYAPQPYGYADPRYGQYALPARRPAQPTYDPRYDDEDEADAPADPRTAAPQRGYWGYR